MAVVSISRIQIRRGRKNTGTGLPQLASGEFAWAIDAQELYIGNGSVSEGSPAVGNTKILTIKDNVFEYALNYIYRKDEIQTGIEGTLPVSRSLQERLDDRVSIRSFGALGDGSNQTLSLQRALFQLFLNDDKNDPGSRHILHLEPGIYVIDSTIYVPPYTTIVGAGSEKTVIRYIGTGSAFKTINSYSTLTSIAADLVTDGGNQPRYLRLEGISIEIPTNVTALELTNCRDSTFTDIEIAGAWETGIVSADVGIKFNGIVSCINNKFNNVKIKNIVTGIMADYNTNDNIWENCYFDTMQRAVLFGNQTVIPGALGPKYNTIETSIFRNIDQQAIHIIKGQNNISSSNKFYSVGNNGGDNFDIAFPVIQFDDVSNLSKTDWFERSVELGTNPAIISNIVYVPEVAGTTIYQSEFTTHLPLTQLGSPVVKIKLPADAYKTFEVEYFYKSNYVSARRQGVLEITVDPNLNQKSMTDSFDYMGDSQYIENLDFSIDLFDENADSLLDTIGISIVNLTINDNAQFYYRVKTKT